MGYSLDCETGKHSAGKVIPRPLREPKVHCGVNSIPLSDPILNLLNQIQNLTHSAGQLIPCLLWNSKIRYSVYNVPLLGSILSLINPKPQTLLL
jgi:hypothetical protein